jgi:type IV pilus assembly protein PilN
MRNLESSGWMSKPELSVIEAKKPEAGKDGPGPVTDISALPYMFEVKVTLPAQSEPVGGVGPDGSVVVPADAAAIPADPAAAPAPAVAPLSPAATPASTPPAAAPAPAAEPSKPSGSRIAPPAAPAQPAASSTPQKGGA